MAEAGVIFERGGITFSGRTGGGATPGGARGGGGGGLPDGFTVQKRITQIQWDSENHKLQIKKANVLVQEGSEDADWTDLLAFAEYDA